MGEKLEDRRKLLLMALACVAEEEAREKAEGPDQKPSRIEIWLAEQGIDFKQYQAGDENR